MIGYIKDSSVVKELDYYVSNQSLISAKTSELY